MPSLHRRALAAGATVAVMAATAGPALASAPADPVVAAIKSQDQALKATSKIQVLAKKKIANATEAKQAEPVVHGVIAKLNHAADVVAQAQAPTSQDKRGQKEWVTAIHHLAKGFGEYDVALKDLIAGNKSGAQAEAVTFEKTIIAAGKLGMKADKLLGVN